MNQLSRFVSLHPYFKVPSDKMPYLKAILPEIAAKTRNETGNLFYEFTINGDEVFCREGYVNAEALLAHLENVGAMLAQALAMADLIRIEVHGPAAELAKLKEPLAHLKPALVRIAQLIAMVGANYSKASIWCASWRLCAGSASTHANVPALTAIINSKPNQNPPRKQSRN